MHCHNLIARGFSVRFACASAVVALACLADSARADLERMILREVFPSYPAGVPADARTFHLFAEFSDTEFAVSAAQTLPDEQLALNLSEHPGATFFEETLVGGPLPPNSALFPFFPELEHDTYVAIGLLTDDADTIILGKHVFTPTSIQIEWIDSDQADRQGEGVENPSTGNFETLLAQFTITGMTPGGSPPDSEGLVDPTSVFDGGLQILLRDGQGMTSLWFVQTLSSEPIPVGPDGPPCEAALNELPPSGATFDDWIGPVGSETLTVNLNDPVNWSGGAPTTTSQIRIFNVEANVFTRLTANMEARGISLRGRARSLNIDLQSHVLTLSGPSDAISDYLPACDEDFGGSIQVRGDGLLHISAAPIVDITRSIVVSDAAQFSAQSVNVPGFLFAILEGVIALSGELAIDGSGFVSATGDAMIDVGSLSYQSAPLDETAHIDLNASSTLMVNGACDIVADPSSDGIEMNILGLSTIDTESTHIDGGGSRLTLSGASEWRADTLFDADQLEITMEGDAKIIAPDIQLGAQADLRTPDTAQLVGQVALADGATLKSEESLHIAGDLITSSVGNELRARLSATGASRGSQALFSIAGDAELANATIVAELDFFFEPSLGQTFLILSASQISSPPAAIELPDLTGDDPTLGWRILESPTDLTLEVVLDCPGDTNFDGAVGASDLAELLGNWGPADITNDEYDLDGDGVIGAADLAELIGRWGPCP